MKSSIFKKALLISMASLTTLSTLSGSISTKIHAIEPKMQESIGDITQKHFVTCSCGGFNFIVCYYEDDLTKEEEDEFVKEFKKVMVPYNEKIQKEKEFTCVFVAFGEIMKKFLSIKEPENQREYFENYCLRPYIENYIASMITCSHGGYNFVMDPSELVKKGLNEELVDQFAEKVIEVTNEYNSEIPENKVLTNPLIDAERFYETMNKLLSTQNNEEQREIINSYLRKVIRLNQERHFVKCSFGGYNFKFYFFKTPKDESERRIIEEFMERFKEVMDPYDETIPKEKEIARMFINADKIIGEFFSKKTPNEQKWYIKRVCLEPLIENIEGKVVPTLIKCSYKGYNIVYTFDTHCLNKEDRKMVNQFVEKLKKVTSPYNLKISEEKEIIGRRRDIEATLKLIRDFLSLKTSEEQRQYIENYFDFKIKKFTEREQKSEPCVPTKSKKTSEEQRQYVENHVDFKIKELAEQEQKSESCVPTKSKKTFSIVRIFKSLFK